MIRTSTLLLPFLALNGCFIYDGTMCRGHHEWGCMTDEDGVTGDTSGLTDDTAEPVPEAIFQLDPNEASGGDVFIASLTAENFDLSTITAIEAYGPATVAAVSNRGDEVLLTIAVSADAAEDETVDLLLSVGDDAVFAEDILLLHAASDDGSGSGDGGNGSGEDCDTGSGPS